MAIAGHHSGLLNGGVYRISDKGDGTFFGRIKGAESLPDYAAWKRDIVLEDVDIPAFCRGGSNPCFTMSFFYSDDVFLSGRCGLSGYGSVYEGESGSQGKI